MNDVPTSIATRRYCLPSSIGSVNKSMLSSSVGLALKTFNFLALSTFGALLSIHAWHSLYIFLDIDFKFNM